MTTLMLARQLKKAGLVWTPVLHDFFAIPERGLDERVFVISNMLVTTDIFQGFPVVTFQGASEWALDYLITSEAVWMPTEEQLRTEILHRLPEGHDTILRFICQQEQFTCEIEFNGRKLIFSEPQASEAYGKALLFLLEQDSRPRTVKES